MSSKRGLRGVPSASHSTGSVMASRDALTGSRCGRHVSLRSIGAAAKEVVFHLAGQVLASPLVGEVQAVFVHQHGLLLEPLGPGFLAHVLVNALAEFTRIRRKVETFGFLAELD